MCPRSSAAPVGPRTLQVVVVGLVLASVLTIGGAATFAQGATTSHDDPVNTHSSSAADQRSTPLLLENNTIEVALDSSGHTEWTITWFYRLSDEEGADQFRELATEFERGDIEDLQTLSEFRNVSDQLDSEQQRTIQITDVQRRTSINDTATPTTGRVQLSFTWENLAQVDGERLKLNDTLTTEQDGLWLDGLAADQQLIVRIPPGYGVFDASVDVRDGALRWSGPTTFDEETLQATFVGDGNTETPTPTPTPTPAGEPNDTQWGLAGLLVVALVIGGVLVSLTVRYRDELFAPLLSDSDDEPAASGGSTPPEEPPVAPAEQAHEAETDEIDEELLSDEERVERLLETNGGRMKQADIVEETDWSNAKVSQLLSSMEDEGRIDKLRIGRENLISFPDVDVTELENDE